jgi:hypothetical protein
VASKAATQQYKFCSVFLVKKIRPAGIFAGRLVKQQASLEWLGM